MDILWLSLLIGRLWLVLIPQTGYIHPDEFFQSVEVTAGDVFNFSIAKPWEFRSVQPIRTSVLNSILIGIPFHVAKIVSSYLGRNITAYHLLVIPRVCSALLSIIVDITAIKLCGKTNCNYDIAMILVSTSYVTLTYLTRTFSNSLETFLFCAFILFISNNIGRKEKGKLAIQKKPFESLAARVRNGPVFMRKNTKKTIQKGETKSKTIKDIYDKEMSKCTKSEETGNTVSILKENRHNIFWSFLVIGGLVSIGIFNRPTFLCYIFVPLISKLYFIYLNQRECLRTVLYSLSMGFFVVLLLFVLLDSVYFNGAEMLFDSCYALFSGIFVMDMTYISVTNCLRNIVVTPWNFVMYNTNEENLVEHGIHPRYLHLFVNLPFLFGPMFICLPIFMRKIWKDMKSEKELELETKIAKTDDLKPNAAQMIVSRSKIDMIVLLSVVVPILLLSVFPHQEPRFLIPVLPLVSFIAARVVHRTKLLKLFFLSWIFFNLFSTYIYGFLHQGGVVQALSYINTGLSIDQTSANGGPSARVLTDKYVFFHTYMPPLFLLQSNNSFENVVDLKGLAKQDLPSYIMNLRENCSDDKARLFVVLPYTVVSELDLTGLNVGIEAIFTNHLSLEDPPNILSFLPKKLSWHECYVAYRNFVSSFSLIMLKVL